MVGYDKVAIGAATQTRQAIELATAVSNSFIQQGGDGVFGLGFDILNMGMLNRSICKQHISEH